MALHLYDPLDPAFGDRADTRVERDRTFRICSDCRMCVKLCPSFRSLFEMIDDLGGSEETANLTRSQILAQAATTVLAQANSSPQLALSLLRGQ